jgi:hypothetical protein
MHHAHLTATAVTQVDKPLPMSYPSEVARVGDQTREVRALSHQFVEDPTGLNRQGILESN